MKTGRLRRLKNWFYRGPRNMGAIKVPRFVGYQSFTLTALYWFGYFINTQLTLIGRIMILIGTMMISYCLLDPYIFPMAYLSFTLVCLYIVNLVIGFFFRPSIKVRRYIPEKVICGTPVSVTYNVENTRTIPLWDMKVDAISYQGTSKESVLHIDTLAPGESVHESTSMEFSQRGLVLLPQVFIESSFPFGLWKWGKFGKGTREIKVMPNPLDIDNIQLPFTVGENEDDVMESQQGSGMEFASCREYRFGDNPKHIHWASWARTTVPVVREMTNEGKPAVSLLFDPCYKVNIITKYQDVQAEFELAVSFLAGVSQYLSNHSYCIRNFGIGVEFEYYDSNRPKEIHQAVLSKCAEIEDVRTVKPMVLGDHALEKIRQTKGLLVILLNLDESRKALIKDLEDSGIPVKVYLLGKNPPAESGNFTFISYQNLKEGVPGQL